MNSVCLGGEPFTAHRNESSSVSHYSLTPFKTEFKIPLFVQTHRICTHVYRVSAFDLLWTLLVPFPRAAAVPASQQCAAAANILRSPTYIYIYIYGV